jgi:hypothetical protein
MTAAWVIVPGAPAGKRIGIVKLNESGYCLSDYDNARYSDDDAREIVEHQNKGLGISKEVAESALAGSMFGWHVPAAAQAVEYFKALELEQAARR